MKKIILALSIVASLSCVAVSASAHTDVEKTPDENAENAENAGKE